MRLLKLRMFVVSSQQCSSCALSYTKAAKESECSLLFYVATKTCPVYFSCKSCSAMHEKPQCTVQVRALASQLKQSARLRGLLTSPLAIAALCLLCVAFWLK